MQDNEQEQLDAEQPTDEGGLPDAQIEKIGEKISRLPVVLQAHGEVMAIMPRNVDEASRYATGLCLSGVVPDAFREGGKRSGAPNQNLVLMGILKALEIGVPPQTGLANLLPLNGRFAVWGDLAAALVHRTGEVAKQQTIELGAGNLNPDSHPSEWPDSYGMRVLYWRKGQDDPYIGEFTVRDAKRAGLWNNASKQPWILYPKRMLYNRARAFALRDGFADGLFGLTIAEEVIDYAPPPLAERGGSNRTALLIDEQPQEEADAAIQADT